MVKMKQSWWKKHWDEVIVGVSIVLAVILILISQGVI